MLGFQDFNTILKNYFNPIKTPIYNLHHSLKLMLEISDSNQQGLYRSKSRGKTGNENQGELQWQAWGT